MRGPARKEELIPSLHYMLTLLSRGPRFYSASLGEILRLQRRGYAVLTGATSDDGSREWEITETGRVALQNHAGGEASLPVRPSIRFRERKDASRGEH